MDTQSSRAFGMLQIALVAGALLLLFCAFYVGKNYHYWRYLLATRDAPKQLTVADKFPNAGAAELIEEALIAEHSGDWQGAVDRYIAAKHKDRTYRGLLFRAGKLLYDHNQLELADRVLQNAVELGENIAAANYYRGLIATKNRDFPAAERFLAAATTADPLIAYYHFSWAEALRLDNRPREAIPKYQQAILRAADEQTRAVYRFKIRLAELESGEGARVRNAVAEKEREGPLPVDWLMTAAAAHIHLGNIPQAVEAISAARAAKHPGLFAECARDLFFRMAAEKYREIASAIRLDFDPNTRAFR